MADSTAPRFRTRDRANLPATDPQLQAELSSRAWELCREAQEEGRMTLRNPVTGDERVIDLLTGSKEELAAAKVVLQQVRWLASLTAKARPRTPPPMQSDGFLIGTD